MKYLSLILFPALLLCSCGQTTKDQDNVSHTTTEQKADAQPQNIVKKHINIPTDFNYITNLGSVDIEFSQGEYNIDVEGDSVTLRNLVTDFDSGVLTVSTNFDNYVDINKYGNTSNIKMYITAPELKCVSICSNGGFKAVTPIHAEDLQLGVMSTGKLEFGDIECTTFSLQSSDVGPITIDHLKADDATIGTRSTATVTVGLEVNNLIVTNQGKDKLTLTGKAKNYLIQNPDDPNLKKEF